jgi:hypothetical protein
MPASTVAPRAASPQDAGACEAIASAPAPAQLDLLAAGAADQHARVPMQRRQEQRPQRLRNLMHDDARVPGCDLGDLRLTKVIAIRHQPLQPLDRALGRGGDHAHAPEHAELLARGIFSTGADRVLPAETLDLGEHLGDRAQRQRVVPGVRREGLPGERSVRSLGQLARDLGHAPGNLRVRMLAHGEIGRPTHMEGALTWGVHPLTVPQLGARVDPE